MNVGVRIEGGDMLGVEGWAEDGGEGELGARAHAEPGTTSSITKGFLPTAADSMVDTPAVFTRTIRHAFFFVHSRLVPQRRSRVGAFVRGGGARSRGIIRRGRAQNRKES